MSKWTPAADEKNQGTLEFEIARAQVEEGLEQAFQRNKNEVSIPGFRKGKVTKQLFFQKFGEEALYQQAMDIVLPAAYEAAIDEAGITPVGRPNIEPVSMNKGEAWTLKAVVKTAPAIKLGEYLNLEVEAQDEEVADADVDAEIKRLQDGQAELVLQEESVKAENGDTVVIDFDGSVDGVKFDGGQGKDFSLALGSGQFIPGFEEQLVGHTAGEDVNVNVTFPEDYQAADLAGKEALFEVTIHELKRKELPELDDEFAKDVDEEVETLAELKEKTSKKLADEKAQAAKAAFEDAVISKAVDNASVDGDEIPAEMIDEDVHRQIDQYLGQLQQQGISREMFFQISGQTEDDLHKQFEEGAETRVKTGLILEAIVAAEKIDPSAEQVSEEVASLAAQYNMEEDKVRAAISESMLKHDIAMREAIKKVTDSAKAV
ncbi:trigger factor [Leuconostoc mesenteroides]|uniref:Trigger factor n=2 Tax=Bacillati TaxID=1783272 RepID=TIG_LEUMM|nr:trigger factor [Leuconostoc mesenteroides]Q03W08.1 RecName: Full=Trigger factor; Short=TF; AltName: Full=PPIase [Leuconostoc mesenteroides subsp. mesenteroides ATCC 8293]ABJ62614.1 FKBP-type peptidyl-prolyl cis-trans isomerase (trigger factor) [Leuconostoc mesenteroides subsp. mesenteroides ATCC 8293]MCT3042152.1 trigger factor [Leuconostoc mesenteroides]MCU4664405.1 trigger factor [Leuconostoc mesenteroides]MDG9747434.1 trigger factor [Leuconostoc mesenteroides]QHM55493.1 Trigger factor [